MTLWGSSIDPDPAKVKKFVVPLHQPVLPPLPEPPLVTTTPSPTTRKHPKPTEHLSSSHASGPGENSEPAFPTKSSLPAASRLPTSTPTPDQGWFSDMTTLISGRKWFFGAAGVVLLFAVGAAVFFWRRRRARRARSAEYTSLPAGDDLPMSNIGSRGPRTRELYDAFGEVSDDDDDADEETGLRNGRRTDRSPTRLAFHPEFLEDDDPTSAATHMPIYTDEPGAGKPPPANPQPVAGVLPSSPASVSGDGSWEHAQ